MVGVLFASIVAAHVAYSLLYWIYSAPSDGDVPFSSGFDSGDLRDWNKLGQLQFCCDYSYAATEAPVRDGRYALNFLLNHDDADVRGSRRSELRLPAAEMGGDYRYKFSFFIPDQWENDSVPVTVAQWHAVPDKLYGEAGCNPPLRVAIIGDRWVVDNFWDSKRITRFLGGKEQPEGYRVLYTAPLDRSKWVDWEFRVLWSSTNDGVIEVWKDGVQVVNVIGGNTYNDRYAPYLKLGIYVPAWKADMLPPRVRSRSITLDQVSAQRL